ncbi:PepSY domain-containing protein [Streptomyces sp. NPDC017991]|uniref:PepSY domain-containing protein n=1 Tax=Streptomyces sp. NPDC017991 TaxID=3365026 RepID=UPI00379B7927
MKRTSLVLLTSGALVAAITGTALAGGSDDASRSSSASSISATATATASSGPSSDAPSTSPSEAQSQSQSESQSGAPTADDDTSGPATATPAHPSSSVGSRRAEQIALSHVGGGTITEVEAETEHGRAVWSVKILKNGSRYEVHVDRGSGEITRSRTKSGDDHGDTEDGGRHGRHHD